MYQIQMKNSKYLNNFMVLDKLQWWHIDLKIILNLKTISRLDSKMMMLKIFKRIPLNVARWENMLPNRWRQCATYFVNEISLAFRVKEKSNFYILPMALLDNETVGKEEVNKECVS